MRNGVFKIFQILQKTLMLEYRFNKVSGPESSNKDVFLRNLRNILEHRFYKTSARCCFEIYRKSLSKTLSVRIFFRKHRNSIFVALQERISSQILPLEFEGSRFFSGEPRYATVISSILLTV